MVADPKGGEAENLVGLLGETAIWTWVGLSSWKRRMSYAGKGFVRGGVGVVELGWAVVLAVHHVVFGQDVDAGGGGEVGGGGGADGIRGRGHLGVILAGK